MLAYLPVFGHAFEVWRSDQEFSFGLLIPPTALGLVAWRWKEMVRARVSGPPASLGWVAAGLGLLLLGNRANLHALAGISFLPVVLGSVAYLYGVEVARLAALPALLLGGGLSLFRGLLSSVGFPLQQLTARLSAATASALGVPVHSSGVDLFVGNVHLVVAQACSGMDSLLALLFLGTLFVGLARASLARRALLVALVLPIILAANTLRVTLVLVLSQPLGLTAAGGLLHALLSVLLFALAAALFAAAALILRCSPPKSATRSSAL